MDDTVRKITAEDINPRYNWGRALPAFGTMGVDFEERVDYRRLHRYRLARARQALEKSDLGALLVMDVNNIRYLTSTKIGEWERDKICRWALLTRGSADPILWDFGSAAVHHKLYAPWLKPENCKAGLLGLRGTVLAVVRPDGAARRRDRVADPRGRRRRHAGRRRHHRAADAVRAAEGGPQDRRRPADDAGGARDQVGRRDRAARTAPPRWSTAPITWCYEELKPGVRENDIVAMVNEFLYRHGSDDVEAINAISGERCNPHPHNFTDRMLRPGDQAFFDILQSFMGYRTCYYRTFNVGRATPGQHDAYKKAREWLDNAIALIKPGVSTDKVASVWPKAEEFGFPDETERVRPAVRPRHRLRHPRAADHLARGLDGSPDRDQGGHGVRAGDLLPGEGRLLGRAHRGGGRGHRQGLPRHHAVPGGGTADRQPVLMVGRAAFGRLC